MLVPHYYVFFYRGRVWQTECVAAYGLKSYHIDSGRDIYIIAAPRLMEYAGLGLYYGYFDRGRFALARSPFSLIAFLNLHGAPAKVSKL